MLWSGAEQSPGGSTWLWDGRTWTQAAPATGPTPLGGGTLVDDEARDVVLLYTTRFTGGSWENATWLWDGTAWSRAMPATTPPPRGGAGLAYDATHHTVVLFGGIALSGVTDHWLNETWLWDGMTWTRVTGLATAPTAREQAQMTYDAQLGIVLLVGGGTVFTGDQQDVWLWDGTRWQPWQPALPVNGTGGLLGRHASPLTGLLIAAAAVLGVVGVATVAVARRTG
jgi:hypothetical protein